MVCTLSSTFDNLLCFSFFLLHTPTSLCYSCFIVTYLCSLYFVNYLFFYLFLYVIHVYYALCVCVVMWWQVSYCVSYNRYWVFWNIYMNVCMYVCMYVCVCVCVCVRLYWNISLLQLCTMLLSLFSSRTRAFTSPDNSGQPSSLLRRIFSIQSQRLAQYYTVVVLNSSQERRKMLQI